MNSKAIRTLPGHCERRTKNGQVSVAPRSIFHAQCASSAFTLIELLITIVLMGFAFGALILGFHESLKSLERQNDLLRATILCEELMNEVRSKQYIQAHTNIGADRVGYEFVDDYNGLTDAPPKTIEGVILSNYSDFTRWVFVASVSNDFVSSAPASNALFKRITVVASNALVCISNVSVVSRYDQE